MENDIKATAIKELLGDVNPVVLRNFRIGKDKNTLATVIYINSLVDKGVIDQDVLKPLMLSIQENLPSENTLLYLLERYITSCNSFIETDLAKVIDYIKRGKTVLYTANSYDYIIVDSTGANYRSIEEPKNETALKGSHEGFIENLQTNISMIKRILKDSNLVIENLVIGERSKTDVVLIYIKDIIDMNIVNDARERLNAIDVYAVRNSDVILQYIEEKSLNIFPQIFSSERPDIIC